jgi:class 3 adenylate cyclase
MLDARGRVRIADFGLASVVEQVVEQDALQGTPAYMAPEQISAQQVSIQSDLYALGLILYRLLTGKSATELYKMRGQSAPPAPSTLVSGVPPAVDAIITRCLAPEPRLRPASAREVAAALEGGTPGQAAALVVAVASTAIDRATLAAQLGDDASARLMQAHAQMFDELCRQHASTRVREADEALVLFAHPGDAVHHALAFQRAIQELAQREGVATAIGVGIQLGVRPRVAAEEITAAPRLAVDAATRDVATRLSKLAESGQILLTRGVFDLARQDVQYGLGKLLWLAHGSYELEGVEEPVEVCEVGAEGVAPLAEHAKTHERRVFKFCYDAEKLRAAARDHAVSAAQGDARRPTGHRPHPRLELRQGALLHRVRVHRGR